MAGHLWTSDTIIRLSTSNGLSNTSSFTVIQAWGSPASLSGTVADGWNRDCPENLAVLQTITPNSSSSLSEDCQLYNTRKLPTALPLYILDGMRSWKSCRLGFRVIFKSARKI